MKKSKIILTVFFILFLIGIGFLINEDLIQIIDAIKIDAIYVLPVAIIGSLIWSLSLLKENKWLFVKQSISISLSCAILALLYILIINRYMPSLGEVDVTGEIIKIKPGRGTADYRLREITVLFKNGRKINFNLKHSKYLIFSSNSHIKFKAKIGGLGLLYLE